MKNTKILILSMLLLFGVVAFAEEGNNVAVQVSTSEQTTQELNEGKPLNIDFGAWEKDGSKKTGAAAVGSEGDFWNAVAQPWVDDKVKENLKYADGTESGISVRLINLGGAWGNDGKGVFEDPMYNSYNYPQGNQGGDSQVILKGLSDGAYDLYLYGHTGVVGVGDYEVTLNGNNYGRRMTLPLEEAVTKTNWTEGLHYVKYQLHVENSAEVKIYIRPYINGVFHDTAINGLQIVPTKAEQFKVQPVICNFSSEKIEAHCFADDGQMCTNKEGKCELYVRTNKEKITMRSTCGGEETFATGEGQKSVKFECKDPKAPITESVKCVFSGSPNKAEKCYSPNGSCEASILHDGYCKVEVSGAAGQTVFWQSSCKGYNYTQIDGKDDEIKFDCSVYEPPQPGTKVEIIEYGGFADPFSAKFYKEIKPVLEKKYDGKIEIVFRHFPLEFHENGKLSAMAYECAKRQDAGEKFMNLLFANNGNLGMPSLKVYAIKLGLNQEEFNACLDNGETAGIVKRDYDAGAANGVSGTPTFFIGKEKIVGAQNTDVFIKAIDKALGYTTTEPSESETEVSVVTPSGVCSEGDLRSYECSDASKVTWCSCVGGVWRCLDAPQSACKQEPEEIVCSGCEIGEDKTCIPTGTRAKDQSGNAAFCDIDKKLKAQLEDGASCQNSFECKSNTCSSGVCVNIQVQLNEQKGILQKIVDWLSKLFGFKLE